MLLKKILLLVSASLMILTFASCEDDSSTENPLNNFIGMEMSRALDIPKDATVTVDLKIFATETSSVDRTFNLTVDTSLANSHNPSYYSVPPTVTIPAGSKEGIYQVSVTATNLNDLKTITIKIPQINGTSTAVSTIGPDINGLYSPVTKGTVIYLYEQCLHTKAKLSIKFDNYPEETAWELYDSAFTKIASGGFNAAGTAITGYAALGYADASTFSTNFCLPSGTYTFVIYDDFGDGMYTSATVSGNYTIKLPNGTTLVTGGGDFGTSSIHEFIIP